jgi:hypothetical protein
MKMNPDTRYWLIDKAAKILIGASAAAILSLPMLVELCYIHTTTKSIKQCKVHVDNVDTSRIGGFGMRQFYTHVNGDTTGSLYTWESNSFEPGKDYELSIRQYGWIGESRIEYVKEIK